MTHPLLAELRRRRVFRALVGYAVAAFAVLQIIEPVMHGLHWPEAVLSYVVVVLAAGFPIVVALAWIFDVQGGNVEKTGRARAGVRGWLLLVGIGLSAAAPGLVWYFGFHAKARPAIASPSIAVLPFVNLSAEKDNEYFSDGMTEELINALAGLEGIQVVSRTSAFAYKGKSVNIRQIGEELNVATVLEGSVRRQGSQLRVSAQLISVPDGYHLWSRTYDRELDNVFAVEDEVARAIVQALQPRLRREAALVEPPTENMEAHDLYLKGRYLWNRRTREPVTQALALFEQAIALDPRYALAHSGLADGYVASADYGFGRMVDLLPKAKMHAAKALELDPDSAEAHASLGTILQRDYDWTGAERELKRSIAIRPTYASAHQWYALNFLVKGQLAEARRELELARRLDPTSLSVNAALVALLNINRDYEKAIAQAQKTLELDPNYWPAQMSLVYAYAQSGRAAEALDVLDKVAAASGRSFLSPAQYRAYRARTLIATGNRAEAEKLLEEIEHKLASEPVSAANLAVVHLRLGHLDRAFELVGKAIDDRDGPVRLLKVDPLWDPLRSDPRYPGLLARMNLD